MKTRYLIEEGYFGVWEPFKSFRFLWQAEREHDRVHKAGWSELLEYRIVDTQTGEFV